MGAIDVSEYINVKAESGRRGGAPFGSRNKHNGRLFTDAIRRVLIQEDGKRLRQVVEAMVSKAEEGDTAMIAILLDRVDGKARSMMEMRVEQVVEEMSDADIRRAIASNQQLLESIQGARDTLEGEGIVEVVPRDDATAADPGCAP